MNRRNSRGELTRLVADRLRRGVPPSRLLWEPNRGAQTSHRPVGCNGEPFRGGNRLLTTLHAIKSGFRSPYWLTAEEAIIRGATKLPQAHGVVVYCPESAQITTGNCIDAEAFFEGAQTVFNADQCFGLPQRYRGSLSIQRDFQPVSDSGGKLFLSAIDNIEYGSAPEQFNPFGDSVFMPFPDEFTDDEEDASELVQQHIRLTGYQRRLSGRVEQSAPRESAFEELVTELGTAFLCTELRLSPHTWDNHLRYVPSWIHQITDDERAIYLAADIAWEAVEYLCSCRFKGKGLRSAFSSDSE